MIDDITIAWSYGATLASVLYKPAQVFKHFSLVHLLDETQTCACNTTSRLNKFCDQQTITEVSSFCKPSVHVRTMDLNIIQHRLLRHAVSQGLNHIPLQPTEIGKAVGTVMHAFEQMVNLLQLTLLNFPIESARQYLHKKCLAILKTSSATNKYGFKFSTLCGP